jgi:integrase
LVVELNGGVSRLFLFQTFVKPLSGHTLQKRFQTACNVHGAARLEVLTIHHGRHTFISHASAGGRTLAEVRDAAGHANVSITNGYLHVAVDHEKTSVIHSDSGSGSRPISSPLTFFVLLLMRSAAEQGAHVANE